MRPRFPGMDPWLEQPALWPDVHNRLISAMADDLAAKLVPRYFVGLEQHTYVSAPTGDVAVIRPDVLVGRSRSRRPAPRPGPPAPAAVGVVEMEVEVPVEVPVEEWYLEVRTAGAGKLVTVIEVLSPTNKSAGPGRKDYIRKRKQIFKKGTSLVEVDLVRGGRSMPLATATATPVESPYRMLVSRGSTRPRATLYAFGVRQAIPPIPIPLLPKDAEPSLDLNAVLHALYDRARFDLRLDYTKPTAPPLDPDDAGWARDILATAG